MQVLFMFFKPMFSPIFSAMLKAARSVMQTATVIAMLFALDGGAWAQTKVDLGTQSKNVDFSGADVTKPMRTSTSLPATCSVGELIFLTSAPAGQNIYACTGTNSWNIASGGGGSTAGLSVTISPTVITIGASCSVSAACVVQTYTEPVRITGPTTCTRTGGSGSGIIKVYVTAAGSVVCDAAAATGFSTWTSVGGNAVISSTPAAPATALQLADVTVTFGAISAVLDTRSTFSRPQLVAGTGIAIGAGIASIDTAVAPLLGSQNVFTNVNDFSAASLIQPRGNGVPSAAACASDGDVGKHYTRLDTLAANASDYGCHKTGASSFIWELLNGVTPQSGLIWPYGLPNSTTSSENGTANTPYYYALSVPYRTVTSIFAIPSTGVAGSIAWGLYDASCNKIAQTNTLTPTAAAQVWTFSPAVTLNAGKYYLAYASNASDEFRAPAGADSASLAGNAGGALNYFAGSNASNTSSGVTTLPATCGTKTAAAASTNLPGVGID